MKRKIGKKKVVDSKVLPLGVKSISIFDYVVAGLMIVLAVFMIVLSGSISKDGFREQLLQQIQNNPQIYAGNIQINSENIDYLLFNISILVKIFITVFIIIALLNVVVGIYLWRGKNWARFLQIALSIFMIMFSINGLFSGDIYSVVMLSVIIILNLLIVYYLSFDKKVKTYFDK